MLSGFIRLILAVTKLPPVLQNLYCLLEQGLVPSNPINEIGSGTESQHWDLDWDLCIPGPANGRDGMAISPGNGTGPRVPQNIILVSLSHDPQLKPER